MSIGTDLTEDFLLRWSDPNHRSIASFLYRPKATRWPTSFMPVVVLRDAENFEYRIPVDAIINDSVKIQIVYNAGYCVEDKFEAWENEGGACRR